MKLLFITQKVHKNDDIKGFVHGWLEGFSHHFDSVVVICLERGDVELPKNISVYSLGKERLGRTPQILRRIVYIFRFYALVWKLKDFYSVILVHMNAEYMVLGGMFWRVWRKRTAFWYNHTYGGIMVRCAVPIAQAVLHVSPYAFTARFKKAIRVPAGLEEELFARKKDVPRKKRSILFLGRISTSKNVDILVEAARILDAKGVLFSLRITGNPSEGAEEYLHKVKELAAPLERSGKIIFSAGIPHRKTPEAYSASEIFVNLTLSGSFDKTVLEAMACEMLVVASNRSFKEILPPECIFKERDPEDLALKLQWALDLPEERKAKLGKDSRSYAVRHHGLNALIDRLEKELALPS